MKTIRKAWTMMALAAGAWAVMLAAGAPQAGAAEEKAPPAAMAEDAATTQPGITVTGQLKVTTDSLAGFDLTDCAGALMAAPPRPPADVIKQGREAVQKWFQEWQKKPEGEAQSKLIRFRKMVTIGKDGRFQIADVPAGKFMLRIVAFKTEEAEGAPGQPRENARKELLAQTSREFEVSQQQVAAAGKPLDLGAVELAIPKVPQVGEVAPDFKVPTLDGKTVSLKEYRGKVVLLDFWATWCGPCRAEMPNLKAAFEKFGKNPKFVLLSLSLDNELAEPQAYVKENDMAWPQGFLGKWSDDKVTKTYGVNSIPATFLIGPDGKIIDKGLRGERVTQGVAKALGVKLEEQKEGKEGAEKKAGQGGQAGKKKPALRKAQ